MNTVKKKHFLNSTFYVIAWLDNIIVATIYPKREKSGTEATFSWAEMGYYLYIIATFICKDLSQLTFKDKIMSKAKKYGIKRY